LKSKQNSQTQTRHNITYSPKESHWATKLTVFVGTKTVGWNSWVSGSTWPLAGSQIYFRTTVNTLISRIWFRETQISRFVFLEIRWFSKWACGKWSENWSGYPAAASIYGCWGCALYRAGVSPVMRAGPSLCRVLTIDWQVRGLCRCLWYARGLCLCPCVITPRRFTSLPTGGGV